MMLRLNMPLTLTTRGGKFKRQNEARALAGDTIPDRVIPAASRRVFCSDDATNAIFYEAVKNLNDDHRVLLFDFNP